MSNEHIENLLVKCPHCPTYFIPGFDGDEICDACLVIENIKDSDASVIISETDEVD
jgi:hypothetical protein